MRPTREQYRLNGTGPKGSVCLMLVALGIGDDISALPVIAELAKTHAVTVYTCHAELWRGIAVDVMSVLGTTDGYTVTYRCEDGTYLDLSWDAVALRQFETIYKLSDWCVWSAFEGNTPEVLFKELADLIGVEWSGQQFDYVAALGARKIDVEKPYAILSVESNEPWRTVPEDKAFELYVDLLNYSDVVWLTSKKPDKRKTRCPSLMELIHLIYNAERVIGIDNGVAHIAAAFRKSVTLIGGPTDIRKIFGQYEAPLNIIQMSGHGECSSPCYRLPSNGFTNQKCCGSYDSPKCLEGVRAGEVVQIAYDATVTH